MELKNKYILDACCSVKAMWYNKNHPNAVYIDIREEEKGFNQHEKNLEVKPDYHSALREKAKLLSKLGRKQEALDLLNDLVVRFPKDDLLQIERGYVLTDFGRFNEALDCFQQALEIYPDDYVTWLWERKTRSFRIGKCNFCDFPDTYQLIFNNSLFRLDCDFFGLL